MTRLACIWRPDKVISNCKQAGPLSSGHQNASAPRHPSPHPSLPVNFDSSGFSTFLHLNSHIIIMNSVSCNHDPIPKHEHQIPASTPNMQHRLERILTWWICSRYKSCFFKEAILKNLSPLTVEIQNSHIYFLWFLLKSRMSSTPGEGAVLVCIIKIASAQPIYS